MNYYKILNIDKNFEIKTLDNNYLELEKQLDNRMNIKTNGNIINEVDNKMNLNNDLYISKKDLRKAWRILRDKHFKSCYDKFGDNYIKASGWFDDKANLEEINNLYKQNETANFNINNLKDYNQKQIILLSSGAYAPFHYGHINMMIEAKNILESNNYKVSGAFLSPCHDEYLYKKHKTNNYNIDKRLNDFIKIKKDFENQHNLNLDWLNTCSYEASVDRALVLSDVIRLMENILKRTFSQEIEIWYVVGSDNYNYARIFTEYNGCIIVKRENYDIEDNFLKNFKNNVLITDNKYLNHSSTLIRSSIIK